MPGSAERHLAVKFASWYQWLSEACLWVLQASQGRTAQRPQQSFDSWADVSPNPVQPLVITPNGSLDTT